MESSTTNIATFFARQPIFDRSGMPLGYELLYRPTLDAVTASGNPEQITAQVAVDAMLGMNIDLATEGLLAFINAPREILVGGALDALDPERVVIEILETVIPDDEVVRACERLVRKGYTLALDDWYENDARVNLLPHARIIKVDVLDRSVDAAAALVSPMRGRDFRLLAERVESADVHDACLRSGFDWFQGYFYRKPEIVRQPDLEPQQLLIVRAMNLVQDDSVTDHRIGEFLERDPDLAIKLIRLIDTVPHAMRTIESVEHAVSGLGRDSVFRWLSLLLVASAARENPVKRELLNEALVRARQCEILADSAGIPQAGHLFLVGLFSRIESLLGIPLSTLVSQVALPAPIGNMLETGEGPWVTMLAVAEACEDARWDKVAGLARSVGVPVDAVPQAYREALEWAMHIVRTL